MLDVTVLVVEGAYASSVAVTRDVLAAAETLAGKAGASPPRWRICSIGGGPVPLCGGLSVQTQRLSDPRSRDRSLWIIPGLGLNSVEAVNSRLEASDALALVRRLARHVNGGGQIAASCSAVFLLRAAGLLTGRRATTTWWLAPGLQHLDPTCSVDADQMICVDGPIVTAGAAFAQADLMLHLVSQLCGPALAAHVSKYLLLDARRAQAPFIVPEFMAGGSDLVARIAAKVEASLPAPPSVAELAREFCMSERTLSRHVRRATGKSTAALIQGIRLRRARNLLETTRMSVERVAEAVGYQGSTALRRLIKKTNGLNPSRFRTSVGA